MKFIQLTQGKQAIVDDDWEDKGYKWYYLGGCACRFDIVDLRLKIIYLHREVMSAPEGVQVDHHNHNKLDNQKHNLRLCTQSENNMNQFPRTTYNGRIKSSKYKGVSRKGRKWSSSIQVDQRRICLGLFDLETDAALAYNEGALIYHGEFALLNVIDPRMKDSTNLSGY